MNCVLQRAIRIFTIVSTLVLPTSVIRADAQGWDHLNTEWWQWALSIPTPVNPMLDPTGQYCMVGQHGPVWFLAGTFFGGTVTRTCSIPEDVVLFFPVLNSINFNTPNVCGQGPQNLTVADLRAASAAFVNAATNISVQLDGAPIQDVHRMRSDVFAVALPEDNVFDAPCIGVSNVPAGVYSPAVDEGLYVRLQPLAVGTHTLRIVGQSGTTTIDVTYILNVVPVLKKT